MNGGVEYPPERRSIAVVESTDQHRWRPDSTARAIGCLATVTIGTLRAYGTCPILSFVTFLIASL